ncbi:cilia- and flagella-associated protein 20-like [Malaya genurostris]|uniref:cilia- and flagella-associated protein 20-like n=1 Tax=Malaya genurostris TaxID=325434 RepID=UPI0026F39799|nr:cilia- and flagella-associated protein 20-like [Malaya genurostris]
MFRNTYQRGFLIVFSSSGSKPLEIWDIKTKNGHAKRVTDEELKLMSFELMGANVATTYMVAPKCPCPSLGIKLPFLVLLVKNLKKFFSFEIQILDDHRLLRRFRASNYQSATRVDNFSTAMPLALTPGWNQIQFNLADFTRRAYGTNYIETVRIQINANVRVKRIYFCDILRPDDELPPQLRLHPPLRPHKISDALRGKKTAEPETVRPPTPEKDATGENGDKIETTEKSDHTTVLEEVVPQQRISSIVIQTVTQDELESPAVQDIYNENELMDNVNPIDQVVDDGTVLETVEDLEITPAEIPQMSATEIENQYFY